MSNFNNQAHNLVRDLHNPRPVIFWADLAITALVAWLAFALAVVLDPVPAVAALVVAAFAFYRGLCFVHELTHLRPKSLPGFETAWNFVFGVPLLLPSFMYVGVHQDHHKISTYGTDQDPEYMPFAQSNLMTMAFTVHSVLIPLFLMLRFLVVSPIAQFFPALRKRIAVHASSLSMNIGYRRTPSGELLAKMRVWELLTFAVWVSAMFAMHQGFLRWRTLAIWYGVTAIASVINTLRTLGAHQYESEGTPMDRDGQLTDSIDTPGNLFTELWAPVGLRYHALHHYFPGIPYHNLSEAHRRMIAGLPAQAPYHATLSSSLRDSLKDLYRKGRLNRAGNSHPVSHTIAE